MTTFATQMESLSMSGFSESGSSSSSSVPSNKSRRRIRAGSGGGSTAVAAKASGGASDVGWMEESAFPGLTNGPLSWLSAAQEPRPVTGAWKIA